MKCRRVDYDCNTQIINYVKEKNAYVKDKKYANKNKQKYQHLLLYKIKFICIYTIISERLQIISVSQKYLLTNIQYILKYKYYLKDTQHEISMKLV